MSADTPRIGRRIPSLIAWFFALNAAAQFTLQAWLAYGFAKHVWRLAHPLPYLVPVALDIFAINLMAAAYELRSAKFRQRIYVWTLLALVIGAQVGASEGFADWANWSLWGRVASFIPAVFLAGSLHALIIVARHRDRTIQPGRPTASPAAVRHVGAALAAALDVPAVSAAARVAAMTHRLAVVEPPPTRAITATPPAATPVPAPRPEPAAAKPRRPRPVPATPASASVPGRGGRQPNPLRADVIKRCLDGGEDAATVAKEIGANVRTAQLWVSKERERRATVTAGDG